MGVTGWTAGGQVIHIEETAAEVEERADLGRRVVVIHRCRPQQRERVGDWRRSSSSSSSSSFPVPLATPPLSPCPLDKSMRGPLQSYSFLCVTSPPFCREVAVSSATICLLPSPRRGSLQSFIPV